MTTTKQLLDALDSDTSYDLTTLGEIRSRLHHSSAYAVSDLPDDAPVAIEEGWAADDGNAEIRYWEADSGEEAAQTYVDDGDWGDSDATDWVQVYAWRIGYAQDEDGEIIDLVVDRDRHTIAIEAEEPECLGDNEHSWSDGRTWGHGGGVVYDEQCDHCGLVRVTDTWAQCRSTGEQGLRSVKYIRE